MNIVSFPSTLPKTDRRDTPLALTHESITHEQGEFHAAMRLLVSKFTLARNLSADETGKVVAHAERLASTYFREARTTIHDVRALVEVALKESGYTPSYSIEVEFEQGGGI